jgi:hypothetical protein
VVEERKRAEYATLDVVRFAFTPVGYDMLGAPGPGAKALLKRLSGRIANRTNQPPQQMLLFHRVEMQAFVQKKLAQMLLVNMDGDGTGRGLIGARVGDTRQRRQ